MLSLCWGERLPHANQWLADVIVLHRQSRGTGATQLRRGRPQFPGNARHLASSPMGTQNVLWQLITVPRCAGNLPSLWQPYLVHAGTHPGRYTGSLSANARGHQCIFAIHADDAHGTPIMLKGSADGISPEEMIAAVSQEHQGILPVSTSASTTTTLPTATRTASWRA